MHFPIDVSWLKIFLGPHNHMAASKIIMKWISHYDEKYEKAFSPLLLFLRQIYTFFCQVGKMNTISQDRHIDPWTSPSDNLIFLMAAFSANSFGLFNELFLILICFLWSHDLSRLIRIIITMIIIEYLINSIDNFKFIVS